MTRPTSAPEIAPFPAPLQAPGTGHDDYEAVLPVPDLPLGEMRRVSRGISTCSHTPGGDRGHR